MEFAAVKGMCLPPSATRPPDNQRRCGKRGKLVISARLFGPAIFEASKLKVVFPEGMKREGEGEWMPRAYTLTHSDMTARITLAVSNTINLPQIRGWYNRLQRDEVVAEWRKIRGEASLHVHCHISGGHFLLDLIARTRFFIFSKELPVVLKAFVHGDDALFSSYPELEDAMVWVYFHSNKPEFNRVECWGPLREAASGSGGCRRVKAETMTVTAEPNPLSPSSSSSSPTAWLPQQCEMACECCFPPYSLVPWQSHTTQDLLQRQRLSETSTQQLQQP